MPEGPEITILSQYMFSKLRGRIIEKLEIISGKYYSTLELKNKDLLDGSNKYKITNIDSHGKLMWFSMTNTKNQKKIYLTSHLGLSGQWGFYKEKNDRIKIIIGNDKNNKKYNLYYSDDRNFGSMEIFDDESLLRKKINLLAPDALKTNFSGDDFVKTINKYIGKSKNRKDQLIFKVLMDQTLKNGIVSGLGNYLTPEILYHAKISPFRKIGSLNNNEIITLAHSIKYIIKLSYYNNSTGYMTNFDTFIKIHKEKIDDKKYPEYHNDIKLKNNSAFEFNVYRKNKDPNGYEVKKDKTINNGRTVYWVPNVQY